MIFKFYAYCGGGLSAWQDSMDQLSVKKHCLCTTNISFISASVLGNGIFHWLTRYSNGQWTILVAFFSSLWPNFSPCELQVSSPRVYLFTNLNYTFHSFQTFQLWQDSEFFLHLLKSSILLQALDDCRYFVVFISTTCRCRGS